jgi:hypothetical protein
MRNFFISTIVLSIAAVALEGISHIFSLAAMLTLPINVVLIIAATSLVCGLISQLFARYYNLSYDYNEAEQKIVEVAKALIINEENGKYLDQDFVDFLQSQILNGLTFQAQGPVSGERITNIAGDIEKICNLFISFRSNLHNNS